MPTRLYYVTYAGNSFDTHVQQADLHSRLLMYTADAIRGFMEDVKRLGRGDDVAMMVFTEFGRARRRERQPRHRSRHRHADVRRRQGRQRRAARPASKPHRSRRRQHEDDDGFPARLRHDDQGVAGVTTTRRRFSGGLPGRSESSRSPQRQDTKSPRRHEDTRKIFFSSCGRAEACDRRPATPAARDRHGSMEIQTSETPSGLYFHRFVTITARKQAESHARLRALVSSWFLRISSDVRSETETCAEPSAHGRSRRVERCCARGEILH